MAVSSYYSFSPNNKCCNYFIKLYLLLQKHNRFLTKKPPKTGYGFQRFVHTARDEKASGKNRIDFTLRVQNLRGIRRSYTRFVRRRFLQACR